MTIELALGRLRKRIAEQREAIGALSTTIDEDRPRRDDVALVGHLADAVLTAQGALEELADAFASIPDENVAVLLVHGHGLFLKYEEIFASEVASFDRFENLLSVARERGREWAGWVSVVRIGMEQCAECSRATAAALLDCWMEVGERRRVVSLHSVSIGQQVRLGQVAGPKEVDGLA